MTNSCFCQSLFTRILFPVAVLSLSVAGPVFGGSPGLSSNTLPSQIATLDGQTYHAVKLLQVLPDGLLVQYVPDSGGVGFARLKFAKLPESFRTRFNYDSRKAADYERDEKIAMTELSRRMREDEGFKTATLIETTRSSVIVDAGAPVIHYVYYDPAGPKPAQISEGMSGDTEYHFSCNPIFRFRVMHQGAGEPYDFHIETVTLRLGVTITINLPKGDIGRLKDHENGHKKIVEYFYSLGPAVAQQAGGLVTGLEQTSSAAEYDAARTEVFTRATGEIRAEYLKYVRDLCEQANEFYDDLTDHGRNGTDPDQAAEKAIRRYAPELASQ